MFMIDYGELIWWYWFLSACFLSCGTAGHLWGFVWAIILTGMQIVHYGTLDGLTSFRMQVRYSYFVILLVALPLPWLYWAPLGGTWIRVIFGYCILARCVSMFPWNRSEPLSIDLVRRRFLSPPVRGSILQ